MKRLSGSSSKQIKLTPTALQRLKEALLISSYSYVAGSTHNFYHYPARFSPAIARSVIEMLSSPGDVVLDPFMGGGTSIIEGLSLGRRIVGVDINSLAHFIAHVRTQPLSWTDEEMIRAWATAAASRLKASMVLSVVAPSLRNLPSAIKTFIAEALHTIDELPLARQRAFARCVLLRLGQWALDCREFAAPRRQRLAKKLPELVDEMLQGLQDFVVACRNAGLTKREIVHHRLLLHRNAIGLDEDRQLRTANMQPRLVFTSPPYPAVHVLYHRWQYRGRKETAAPFWIANVTDGYYESYYTGGSRAPTGQRHYFEMITAAFRSIRAIVREEGWVVQLIGFANTASQLPRYLEAMNDAGFKEVIPSENGERLGRRVPNRKWYATLQGTVDASSELLLFHRPR